MVRLEAHKGSTCVYIGLRLAGIACFDELCPAPISPDVVISIAFAPCYGLIKRSLYQIGDANEAWTYDSSFVVFN